MQKSKRDKVLSDKIPEHIAIIMDGNGRWANSRSLPRIAGHKEGINSVREITRICGEIGVKYLTLYTFSTENWKRPPMAVRALMTLLLKTINIEIIELNKNNVRFTIIGDLGVLPSDTSRALQNGIELTKENDGLNLCLALNYGSRQEIIEAIKLFAIQVKEESIDPHDITEINFRNYYIQKISLILMLIRTRECRLVTFYFVKCLYRILMTDTLWPAFRK